MPTTQQAKDGDPPALFACPNPDGALFNRFDARNHSVAERMGKSKAIRRLYCTHCGRRFSERQGSLMQYTKLADEVWTVRRYIECQVHVSDLQQAIRADERKTWLTSAPETRKRKKLLPTS